MDGYGQIRVDSSHIYIYIHHIYDFAAHIWKQLVAFDWVCYFWSCCPCENFSSYFYFFFTTTGIADVIIMWLTHAPAGGTIGSFQDGVHKIHNSISAGAVHGTARLYRSFYLFTLHAGNGRMSKKEAKKEWNMKVEEDGWFILDTRKDNNEDQLRFII